MSDGSRPPEDLGARDPGAARSGTQRPAATQAPPIDEFTKRRRLHQQKSASTGRVPLFAEYLEKAGRRAWLYRIDPIDGGWRWEVYIGATLHRTGVARTRLEARRATEEFAREVESLKADGWTAAIDSQAER